MMKLEDFSLAEFEGQRLRIVPELKGPFTCSRPTSCTMCLAAPDGLSDTYSPILCMQLRTLAPCGGNPFKPLIFLPEERFEEYVVEVVRRRIS